MIRSWTKLSAILRYLVYGSGLLPDMIRFRHSHPEYQSSREGQARDAGPVQSPAGLGLESRGKAATPGVLSRVAEVYQDQENNILAALSLTVASLSIGLSISLTLGYLR